MVHETQDAAFSARDDPGGDVPCGIGHQAPRGRECIRAGFPDGGPVGGVYVCLVIDVSRVGGVAKHAKGLGGPLPKGSSQGCGVEASPAFLAEENSGWTNVGLVRRTPPHAWQTGAVFVPACPGAHCPILISVLKDDARLPANLASCVAGMCVDDVHRTVRRGLASCRNEKSIGIAMHWIDDLILQVHEGAQVVADRAAFRCVGRYVRLRYYARKFRGLAGRIREDGFWIRPDVVHKDEADDPLSGPRWPGRLVDEDGTDDAGTRNPYMQLKRCPTALWYTCSV